MASFTNVLKGKSDMYLVAAVMAILMILFIPISPVVLDVLLIINFSMAILILLLTFYTDKPLSFSTFPSLLLIATLFRLGLNISATRLILDGGEAGTVIAAVGHQVVGGNYVIGLVVFFILIIVQYVVVTNGAQRVAEVAARFTLDSLPGKQMSIDADLNMGTIDPEQANARRKELEKETNFYGAMDGASKFVKGDAIAGIIIILIDIVGGLSIGIAQLGMSWSEALQTYTLLTVGDGIVTQIPSLVIATATGIIITRAASDAHLGRELANQFMSKPTTLFIVATLLVFMLFMPGLPKLTILIIASCFAGLGYLALRAQKESGQAEDGEAASSGEADATVSNDDTPEVLTSEQRIDKLLQIHPLELKVSPPLKEFIDKSGMLQEQLTVFKEQFVADFGFVLPTIRITSTTRCRDNQYQLYLYGAKIGNGTVVPDSHLVIDAKGKFDAVEGDVTKEPTFGLPAMWVNKQQLQQARSAGYTVVDAETTLLTHVTELCKSVASDLMTRKVAEEIVERKRESLGTLLDELVPNLLSISDVQKIFQNLLAEKVSIQNVELILESLVEQAKNNNCPLVLTAKVREKIKTQITQSLVDDNDELHVTTIESKLEHQLINDQSQDGENVTISMSPDLMDSLVKQVTQCVEVAISNRRKPVILCSPSLRYGLKKMLDRIAPQLNVLSINEIPSITHVKTAGTITFSQQKVA